MKEIIRLLKLDIKNLKNLESGTIEFNSLKEVSKNNFDFVNADIIGVYGPNGSSKTSLINGLKIIKKIFAFERFADDLVNYINFKDNLMELKVKLLYKKDETKVVYDYLVNISRIEEKAYITKEILSYKKFNNELNKFEEKKTLFDVDYLDNNFKTFIKTTESFNKLTNKDMNVIGNLMMLKGRKFEAKQSLIFSVEFFKIMKESNNFNFETDFINALFNYATNYFHVFDNKELSLIASLDQMPFVYVKEIEDHLESLNGYVNLFKESYVKKDQFSKLLDYASLVNSVIEVIVPGVKIGVKDLGDEIQKDGNIYKKCNFVSIKDGFEIPLKYESDGIKRIICILSSYITAFNNKGSLIVVDELDNGIYEYLLGTLVKVFKDGGKGQFLFTSHNLRALEVIKQDIIFTTNDPKNRFSKMTGINSTNNLRDQYIKENYFNNEKFSALVDANLISNALICTRLKNVR